MNLNRVLVGIQFRNRAVPVGSSPTITGGREGGSCGFNSHPVLFIYNTQDFGQSSVNSLVETQEKEIL